MAVILVRRNIFLIEYFIIGCNNVTLYLVVFVLKSTIISNMASRVRLDPNGPKTPTETGKSQKRDGSRIIQVHKTEQRVNIPAGTVPKMPADDSQVD